MIRLIGGQATGARARCIFSNARVAVVDDETPGYGLIDRGAVAIEGDRIVWVGAEADLPADCSRAARTTSAAGW